MTSTTASAVLSSLTTRVMSIGSRIIITERLSATPSTENITIFTISKIDVGIFLGNCVLAFATTMTIGTIVFDFFLKFLREKLLLFVKEFLFFLGFLVDFEGDGMDEEATRTTVADAVVVVVSTVRCDTTITSEGLGLETVVCGDFNEGVSFVGRSDTKKFFIAMFIISFKAFVFDVFKSLVSVVDVDVVVDPGVAEQGMNVMATFTIGAFDFTAQGR